MWKEIYRKKYFVIEILVFVLILSVFNHFTFAGNDNHSKFNAQNVGNLQVALWKNDSRSAFSFSFDDSFISQFENIRPILNNYNFKATFYILPLFLTENLPGIWRYGTWPMFEAMALEGHEIGAHSMTHPHLTELEVGDTLTEGTINYELYWSRQLIRQRITTQKCITFAYPYAEHNEIVDSIASLYYESARADIEITNPPSPTNKEWYSLNAIEPIFSEPRNTPEDDLDELEFLENWIDSSIIKGDWGIFLAHESVPFDSLAGLIAAGAREPMSNQWFEAICQWVYNKSQNNDVWVAPVGDVTRYIKERDSYSYNLLAVDENQIQIRVTDNLDDGIFNYPLSAYITVPDDWNFALTIQDEKIDTLSVFEHEGNKVVMAEVNPAGGILSLYKMTITSVENNIDNMPEDFVLYQNYPNPFNPTTKIKFTLPANKRHETRKVSLIVYDVLGNKIAELVNEDKPAGSYEVEFDGSKLSSGVYQYRLRAGSFVEVKKMILLK